MEYHPIANIFPMLGETEAQELVGDIKAHGQRNPIWEFEKKILDGRNRWNACRSAGVEPEFREFTGTHKEALAFVWSENVQRRHLESGQLACAVVMRQEMDAGFARDIEEPIKREAKKRQKSGQTKGGKTAGKGRPKEGDSFPESIPESYESRDSKETATAIAKVHGTNRAYVASATKLRKDHPDQFDRQGPRHEAV